MSKQHDRITQLLTDDSFLRWVNDEAIAAEQQRWDRWLEEGKVPVETAMLPDIPIVHKESTITFRIKSLGMQIDHHRKVNSDRI